ncbi:MAG: hypothetical protein EON59_00355 [Alphaproteobacteria bacterium]|nr:MAG: hypothetical protein EON59_00355 [Alphaproteobacteria bacterium]
MDQESKAARLLRLAREEYDMAENAPDPAGYRGHLELARAYERRARLARHGERDEPHQRDAAAGDAKSS